MQKYENETIKQKKFSFIFYYLTIELGGKYENVKKYS